MNCESFWNCRIGSDQEHRLLKVQFKKNQKSYSMIKYCKSTICQKFQTLQNCELKTFFYFNWFQTDVKSCIHNQVLQLLNSYDSYNIM